MITVWELQGSSGKHIISEANAVIRRNRFHRVTSYMELNIFTR